MRRLIILLCLFAVPPILAQPSDSLVPPAKTENYISLYYDNDFFSATDRYYTQGILLNFIHPIVRYSPFSYTLIKLSKQALNYYGFHLEQDVFTPISIRYMDGAIYYGERPFTAVFFATHSLTSMLSQKHLLLRTSLDLGVMGPAAKGEEEQKGIHKALNNIQPQGWENQLNNDVVINYNTRVEKGLINSNHFELMGAAALRLGTLYTDAGLGLQVRAGIFAPYFSCLGLENDPARRKHKFKIYGFARANGRVVGYNATLQGGLINTSSVYTLSAGEINRFVFDCQGGIVIAYKRVSLEYSKAYITPEFRRGVDHGWGRCAVTVCF